MVKLLLCDKCRKEIKKTDESFDDLFEEFSKNFSPEKEVMKLQLCPDCLVGYNEIIKKTNDEIKAYLKEGKETKTDKKKKWKLF